MATDTQNRAKALHQELKELRETEIASLQRDVKQIKENDLTDIRINLARLEHAEEVLKTVQDTFAAQSETLKAVSSELNRLKEAADAPIYKDRRFWAGLILIPSLVVTGRLMDVAGKPQALSLLHDAFGTQKVVLEAIKNDNDDLHAGLSDTVTKLLTGNAAVGAAVSEEVSRRFNTIHSVLLQVGLSDPKNVHQKPCQEDPSRQCEDLSDAITHYATSVFGARHLGVVNIDFGIYIAQLHHDEQGLIQKDAKPSEILLPPAFNTLLTVSMDEQTIPLPESAKEWLEFQIGGEHFRLAHIHIEGQKLVDASSGGFPLHTMTIRLNDSAPRDYFIQTAVMISSPEQSLAGEK
jgi:hypothetical protein